MRGWCGEAGRRQSDEVRWVAKKVCVPAIAHTKRYLAEMLVNAVSMVFQGLTLSDFEESQVR